MAKLVVLYWLLLQAMVSSFTGFSSLPIIRHELVAERHWIDDRELNAAIMIGRSTPGPIGVYIVSIGYFVAGWPGAAAGLLAMSTPALLILLLWRLLGNRVEDVRIQNAIRYVILAGTAYSAVLLISLSKSALTSAALTALSIACGYVMLRTKIATIWILAGAGLVAMVIQ